MLTRLTAFRNRGESHRTIPFLTISNVLAAIANSGAAFLATLVLGPKDRGVMVLCVTIGSVVALAAGAGSGPTLRSRLPGANFEERESVLRTYNLVSVASTILGGCITAVAVLLLGYTVDPALVSLEFAAATALFCSGQICMQQMNDRWFADGEFRAGSVWSLAGAVCGFVGVGAGAALFHNGWSMLFLQAAGIGIVATVQGQCLRRRAPGVAARFGTSQLRWFLSSGMR